MRGYLHLIWKDYIFHVHGLAVYVKKGLPFARDLSLENSADSYLCFWLALLHSVSYFFFRASNCMFLSATNDKFDKWWLGKFSSLSYHKSNLSSIAQETKWLLVNYQLISIAIQPKNILLEQICYKRSQDIAVTSLLCLLFSDIKKQRPKTNLKKCYQCSVIIEIFLDIKVCFSLVTY